MSILVCWLFSGSGFMVIFQSLLGHLLRFLPLAFLLHLEFRGILGAATALNKPQKTYANRGNFGTAREANPRYVLQQTPAEHFYSPQKHEVTTGTSTMYFPTIASSRVK